MNDYQDNWPRCVNFEECGGRIYLTHNPRDRCRAGVLRWV